MLRSICLGGVASVGTQAETMTGEPMFFEIGVADRPPLDIFATYACYR
jgi:hypothetical protein